ncbi:MAG TPA: hypothetical protein VMT10_14670, partial [Solirubrobacteraceae bacterium]|nr:hypothetical protein [Solirubrobacteraceae bacterium]
MVFDDGRGSDGLHDGLAVQASWPARLISADAAFWSAMWRAAFGPLGTKAGSPGADVGADTALAATALTGIVVTATQTAIVLMLRAERSRVIAALFQSEACSTQARRGPIGSEMVQRVLRLLPPTARMKLLGWLLTAAILGAALVAAMVTLLLSAPGLLGAVAVLCISGVWCGWPRPGDLVPQASLNRIALPEALRQWVLADVGAAA